MPTITTVDATWDTGVTMDAAELRRADSAMFLGDGSNNGVRGGVVYHGPTSLGVTVNGSDQVTVQAGAFVIPAGTGLGVYRGALSAATTATALASRNATNPRIDLIVIQATGTNATVKTIEGTPGAVPTAPSLPVQHIEIGRVNVPATGGGAVTVDLSWRAYVSAVGGTIFSPTFARFPTSGIITGQRGTAIDTGTEYKWNGSAWLRDGQAAAGVLSVVNFPLNAGTSTHRYTRIGDWIFGEFHFIASGAGSGAYNFPLPAAARAATIFKAIGTAILVDTGTGSYSSIVSLLSTTTAQFLTTASPNAVAATAVPFTWIAGDIITGTYQYEAA